jgi:4-hydroxybenzoate polyprenyltransferase
VTADYPVGIAVALGGGYLAQQSALPAGVVGSAAVFVPTLAGVKVSVDRLDREFDRTIDKRTVPVVLGDRRSRWVSAGLFLLAAALVGLLVAGSLLTGAALLAVPALVGGAVVGHDDDPARAVARQMLLVYPLAAVLFVSRCLATGCVVAAAVSAFP